jgi:hypothetical protein
VLPHALDLLDGHTEHDANPPAAAHERKADRA